MIFVRPSLFFVVHIEPTKEQLLNPPSSLFSPCFSSLRYFRSSHFSFRLDFFLKDGSSLLWITGNCP